MQEPEAPATARTAAAWRAALAGSAGSFLEFYDFFVYSPLAALVFAKIFFPSYGTGVGTLLSLSTFAIGFLSRPLGGAIAGHLGDRLGRRPTLMMTFLFTGVVTVGVGLLPTYAQAGIWAPIGLVALRFLQGLGLGGEWGGAALLAVEHAPEGRRAFFGSIIAASAPLGVIAANGVVALLTAVLSHGQLLSWGWRLPFLFSIVLVVMGLVLRARVPESPEFERVRRADREVRMPVAEALRRFPRQILAVIGLHTGPTTLGFLSGTFLVSYAALQMHINPTIVLLANVTGSVVNFALTPLVGRIADRIGSHRLIIAAGVGTVAWAFPMFWLIGTHSVVALYTVYIVTALIQVLVASQEPVFYGSLFSPEVRYSGISLGYQIATIIGGGLGPIIAQALVNGTHGQTWPVAAYVVLIGFVFLVATFAALRWRRPSGASSPEPDPEMTRAAE